MKIFLTQFVFIILLFSCQTKQPETKTSLAQPLPDTTKLDTSFLKNKDSAKVALPFSVMDSLNKYIGTDSMYVYPDKLYYIGDVNGMDFAIVRQTDSTFILYQKNKNSWIVKDTLKMNTLCYVTAMDLNGDNIDDLRITTWVSGIGGNRGDMVLLFDPKKKEFKHNAFYDMANVDYDKEKHVVRSHWFYSIRYCQRKSIYKITGDSLTIDMEVEVCPFENNQNKKAGLEITKKIDDLWVIVDRIDGDTEQIWDIFHKTFWDTSDPNNG